MLSSADQHRISEQLRFFGCNERETAIYVQLLQAGACPVQDLARRLKQNRVTVHSAVQQMIGKGLVFETRKAKRRLVVAEEPVSLLRLFQQRESEMQAMRPNLEHTISLLASLQGIQRSVPTVKLYEGTEGFKRMLEETLTARGEVLVFSYVDLFSKLVDPGYLVRYFTRRAAKNIHTRLLFPHCAFADLVSAKSKEHKIQVRLLPVSMTWKSGIFSWNDCLALLSYTEQQLTCTIIENKDIAHFFRTIIFELCWQQAKSAS